MLPHQVVAPDQPGRKVCMLGATGNLLSALPWVHAADAVVLGADIQVNTGSSSSRSRSCSSGSGSTMSLNRAAHYDDKVLAHKP